MGRNAIARMCLTIHDKHDTEDEPCTITLRCAADSESVVLKRSCRGSWSLEWEMRIEKCVVVFKTPLK